MEKSNDNKNNVGGSVIGLPTNYFNDYTNINTQQLSRMKDIRFFPSFTRKQIKESESKVDQEALLNTDDETKLTYGICLKLEDKINPDDIFKREINKNIDININYDDKELKLDTLKVKRGSRSSKTALYKLLQSTGIGSPVIIPLWNSGFWVTIEPFKPETKINLMLELGNELVRVGRDYNGLVYSNSSVIFAEIIAKYFKEYILHTSLKLPDDDDIFNYIKLSDMYSIALGIAHSMYPKGYHIVIPCRNSLNLNDEKLPSCNYKAKLHIDNSKLFWIDKSILTEEHLQHMAKRAPNSITVDDIKNYQESIEYPVDNRIAITTDDVNITIELETPNLTDYFNYGSFFIEEIRKMSDDLLTKNRDITKPEEAEQLLLSSIYLRLYQHYIKSIRIDDNDIITDKDDVIKTLDYLTDLPDVSDTILNGIKNFIDKSTVSVVGIPNFVCPKCKSEQTEDTIIPLSVYEHFFLLLDSHYRKIVEKIKL